MFLKSVVYLRRIRMVGPVRTSAHCGVLLRPFGRTGAIDHCSIGRIRRRQLCTTVTPNYSHFSLKSYCGTSFPVYQECFEAFGTRVRSSADSPTSAAGFSAFTI